MNVDAVCKKFNPLPYKVSTITATGSVGVHIDLNVFFDLMEVEESPLESDELRSRIVYVEYGHKRAETTSKGHSTKPPSRKKKESKQDATDSAPRRRFDNQATLIIRMPILNREYCGGDQQYSKVNMKVFKNGNVQMTGLKYIEQGVEAINHLIQKLESMVVRNPTVIQTGGEGVATAAAAAAGKISNLGYQVRLINCDFRIGIEIKRDKLYKILQQPCHKVYCSYEPCIYPGVKIQYNCNGKKITISVFQSGCIIITGAHTHAQIQSAYAFICDVMQQNLDTITKPTAMAVPS